MIVAFRVCTHYLFVSYLSSSNEKGEIEMIQNQPAVLYAAVDDSRKSQKKKEAADGHYDDPDVTKPPTTEVSDCVCVCACVCVHVPALYVPTMHIYQASVC